MASPPDETSSDQVLGSPPSTPHPSKDPGIVPPIAAPSTTDGCLSIKESGVTALSPLMALQLLCHHVDTLVKLTGDIPPTPPVARVKSVPSEDSVAENGAPSPAKENVAFVVPAPRQMSESAIGSYAQVQQDQTTGVTSEGVAWSDVQQAVITRKFYCKKPPPISPEDYLKRIHRYCPASTAVYLATSVYITRLAVVERILPVTPRNVHRLLLAGLRVAIKALEDLSYSHTRFAQVGGVSEAELAKLEITFCYLTNFELKVDLATLQAEYDTLHAAAMTGKEVPRFQLRLPTRNKSRAESPLATVTIPAAVEAPS